MNNIEIVEPKVELITPVDHLLTYPQIIELCGRTCYKSEDKITSESSTKFIKSLLKRGHESVIEHCSISYKLICSRACSHQLVRHRIAAYCIDGEALTETTIQGVLHNGRKFKYKKRRTIKQLFDMKQTSHGRSRLKLVKLNCINEENGKIIQNNIQDVLYSGKKSCVYIEIDHGKYNIKATKNHRFLTPDGWLRLEEIIEKNLSIAVNGIQLPDLSWLNEEYHIKNRTRREIATELGISESWLGKYIAENNLQKPINKRPRKGIPGYGKRGMLSIEQRQQISNRMRGDKNHRWRGGITSERSQLQKQISKELRQSVYQRDDYTCRLCYIRGGTLTLHHIIPCYQDKTLFFDPENLVTVCDSCHKTKINNHEHEFQDYFKACKPIQPRPNIKKAQKEMMVHFLPITNVQEIGEIDTYDIVMKDPHHNFIANGLVVHNSQESMRYCDYSRADKFESLQVIVPPSINQNKKALEIYLKSCIEDYESYKFLRDEGIPPEDARFSLPTGTKTEVISTYNLRMWRHVISSRGMNPHAQWEIRKLFLDILYELNSYIPVFFNDLVVALENRKGNEKDG